MRAYVLLIAGWLVPGLGHLVQRKFWRAGVFFVSVCAMTAMGLAMGGRIYPFQTENPLTILAFDRATFEFGTAYIAGAGLLNYLIALDAYDIARGKKK
jgi:hypothetical protein